MKTLFNKLLIAVFVIGWITACTPSVTEFHSPEDVINYVEGKKVATDFGTVKFKKGKAYNSDGALISEMYAIKPNSLNPTKEARFYIHYGSREVKFLVCCDKENGGIIMKY